MGKSKWNMVLSAAKRSDADRLGMDQRTVVLFLQSGAMQIGWVLDNHSWYFMQNDGSM